MNTEDIVLLLLENNTDSFTFRVEMFADEHMYYFSYYSQKTELEMSCRSSSMQTIKMKCQI